MSAEIENKLLNACPSCDTVMDVSAHGPYQKVTCPACGEGMRVRTRFDHFEIQKKVGEGGMSLVFEALDTKLDRPVALKILHPEFSEKKELTDQFEREARLTAAISHPNIVEVYSVGRDQGYFYIAMELVGGKSLEELIAEEGKIEERHALNIGIQMAQGLRAAHNRGLIHRDIKPGNILFSDAGVAKLVDFGLALVAGGDDEESEELWATPYYVPPEKLEGEPEDARSDIYSLGATLFHALAGHPPFAADTSSIEELKRMKAERVSLHAAAPEASEPACGAIDRMMSHDPGDRPATCDDLLEDLNRARGMLRGERELEKGGSYRTKVRVITAVVLLAAAGVMWALRVKQQSGKGDGDDLLPDFVIIENAAGSGHAAEYIAARQKLLAGRGKLAMKAFQELTAHPDLRQPMLNWSRFNGGIAALLIGDSDESRTFFQELEDGGLYTEDAEEQDLAYFFLWVGHHLSRPLPVMPEELDLEAASEVSVMAWLAYGLKNWDHGRFEEAIPFLQAFLNAKPSKSLEWINLYKPLVGDFFHDIELLRVLPKPRSSMTLREAQEAVSMIEELQAELKTRGEAIALCEDRKERAAAHIARLEEDRQRQEAARLAQQEMDARMLREEEFEKLSALIDSVARHGPPLDFGEALAELEQAEFEDEQVRIALEDQKHAWRRADKFADQLVADLNDHGYTGAIPRADGSILQGTITQVSGGQVRVKLALGTTAGETSLPWASLSIDGLVGIARNIAARIGAEADREDRLEVLTFFARQSGREELAQELADSLEAGSAAFRERWDRLENAGAEDDS